MLADEIAKVEQAGLSPHTQDASAARRRRLHLRRRIRDDRDRSRASAACRAIGRLTSRRSACSAARRSSRTSRRCYWVRDIVEKGAGLVHLAWPARAQGFPQLLGLRPREEAGRGARARRRHRARADRGILRRHDRRPHLQGLSAGRRLGRHPAGVDGRHAARFRHAGKIRLLRRLARGCDPVRQGRHEGGGAQPDEVLRGRELRPVHALPRRHREGRQADGARARGTRRC